MPFRNVYYLVGGAGGDWAAGHTRGHCTIAPLCAISSPSGRAHLARAVLGAAYLAGLTVGVFESGEGIAARRHFGQRFEPALPSEERDARYAGWRRAVAQAPLRP